MNSNNQHAYSELFSVSKLEAQMTYIKCPDLLENFPDADLVKIVKLEHHQDGEIRLWVGIGLESTIAPAPGYCETEAGMWLYVNLCLEIFNPTDAGLESAFERGVELGWKIDRADYIRTNRIKNIISPAKALKNTQTGEIYPSISQAKKALNHSDRWIKNAVLAGQLEWLN